MYAHFRSDADGQQAHGELLPVGLHGERVGQGRSGESSVGIDRTGRRQHVVVGGEGDVFRGLVGAQSELHPDTGHQRSESQRNGQDSRCLVDHERGLVHGREHKVVGGQIRRAVSIAPRMREGLVYSVERGGAEGIVDCGARVAADGHAAREGRGRARPVAWNRCREIRRPCSLRPRRSSCRQPMCGFRRKPRSRGWSPEHISASPPERKRRHPCCMHPCRLRQESL